METKILPRGYYKALLFMLLFYLMAQLFQFIIDLGPLAGLTDIQGEIIKSQSSLNSVRQMVIFLSMLVMVPAFIILGLHFKSGNEILSISATVFFLFFIFFETSYRSIEMFHVKTWGIDFGYSDNQAEIISKFRSFYNAIEAWYFPLLLSLLLGSLGFLFISIRSRSGWMLSLAFGISAFQQIGRLTTYFGIQFFDTFNSHYFYVVAVTFILMIVWAGKMGWAKTTSR